MKRHVRVLIAVGVMALMAAVFMTAGRRAHRSARRGDVARREYNYSVTYSDADNVPAWQVPMSPGAGGPPGMAGGPMGGSPAGMMGKPAARAARAPASPAQEYRHEEAASDAPGAAYAATLPAVARKVVMTATLTLEVKEFADVSDAVVTVARRFGGYVGNSQLSLPDQGVQQGTLTIRVPQDRYDAALVELKKLGKVVGEAQSAEDVTERYVDLDARVRNLRAEEERVLDIMRRAKTIKETLQVEERLTAIRERLETLEGQLRYLQYQVSMATITVTLVEKATVLHIAEVQWMWGNEVSGAWHSAVVLLQSLVTVLTYAGVFGIFWVPILGIALWSAKRRRTKEDVPPESA